MVGEGDNDDMELTTAMAARCGETQARVIQKRGKAKPLKYGSVAAEWL